MNTGDMDAGAEEAKAKSGDPLKELVNDYFGNGDPETIRMMYQDMQEFVTACNNIIRR